MTGNDTKNPCRPLTEKRHLRSSQGIGDLHFSGKCRFFSVIYYDAGRRRLYLVFVDKGGEGCKGRPRITLFEFHLMRPEIILKPFLFPYLVPGRPKKKCL